MKGLRLGLSLTVVMFVMYNKCSCAETTEIDSSVYNLCKIVACGNDSDCPRYCAGCNQQEQKCNLLEDEGLRGRLHPAITGVTTTHEVKKMRPHVKMLTDPRKIEFELRCRSGQTKRTYDVTQLSDLKYFSIYCPKSYAINEFKFTQVSSRRYRYTYTCCLLTKVGNRKPIERITRNGNLGPSNGMITNPLATQNVSCANNDMLYQFQMQVASQGSQIYYNGGCFTPNGLKDCTNLRTVSESNQLQSLVQQNPSCPRNFGNMYPFMQQFQLKYKDSSVHYSYTCCNLR